jgi:hypothetical protein
MCFASRCYSDLLTNCGVASTTGATGSRCYSDLFTKYGVANTTGATGLFLIPRELVEILVLFLSLLGYKYIIGCLRVNYQGMGPGTSDWLRMQTSYNLHYVPALPQGIHIRTDPPRLGRGPPSWASNQKAHTGKQTPLDAHPSPAALD